MMKFLVLACLSFIPLAVATYTTGESKCKCFPGDSCWPSEREWKAFNNTVHGRLIKTVPLGSPCHDPDYNEALCEELKAQWTLSSIQ